MTKSPHEVVGFAFQVIPLEEAVNAVLAGDGNYSEIKQTLLHKLPQLPSDKAFAFGLPDGNEVPEVSRRGLCMAVNATLKKAKLNWRITYSNIKKLFICVPKIMPQKKQAAEYIPRSKHGSKTDIPEILKWRDAGFSITEIVQKTQMPIERVKYVCYQLHPKNKRKLQAAEQHTNGNGGMSAAELIEKARVVLGYDGDFKNNVGNKKLARKVISVVGVHDLGLSPKELAPHLEMSKEGIYFNAHSSKTNFGAREIKALQKAVKQEG